MNTKSITWAGAIIEKIPERITRNETFVSVIHIFPHICMCVYIHTYVCMHAYPGHNVKCRFYYKEVKKL